MPELWVIERKENVHQDPKGWEFYHAHVDEEEADFHLADITSHVATFRKRKYIPAEAE